MKAARFIAVWTLVFVALLVWSWYVNYGDPGPRRDPVPTATTRALPGCAC